MRMASWLSDGTSSTSPMNRRQGVSSHHDPLPSHFRDREGPVGTMSYFYAQTRPTQVQELFSMRFHRRVSKSLRSCYRRRAHASSTFIRRVDNCGNRSETDAFSGDIWETVNDSVATKFLKP